jgi:hypothetical protein
MGTMKGKSKLGKGLVIGIAIGIVGILLLSALVVTNLPGGINEGSTSPVASPRTDSVPTATTTTVLCEDVKTCSETLAIPAYTTALVFVYGDTNATPRVHYPWYTNYDGWTSSNGSGQFNLNGTSNFTSPVEKTYGGYELYAYVSTYQWESYSSPIYVNYSSAQTYAFQTIDVSNVAVNGTATAVVIGGDGTNTGNSTGATCPVTTTVTNETVFYAAYSENYNQSTMHSTKGVNITTGHEGSSSFEDAYENVTAAGAVTPAPTISFAHAIRWVTACVGLEPQLVPNAPTSAWYTAEMADQSANWGPTGAIGLRWANPAGSLLSVKIYATMTVPGRIDYNTCGVVDPVFLTGQNASVTTAVVGMTEGNTTMPDGQQWFSGLGSGFVPYFYMGGSFGTLYGVCIEIEVSNSHGYGAPILLPPIFPGSGYPYPFGGMTYDGANEINETAVNAQINFTPYITAYDCEGQCWGSAVGGDQITGPVEGFCSSLGYCGFANKAGYGYYEFYDATYASGSCGSYSLLASYTMDSNNNVVNLTLSLAGGHTQTYCLKEKMTGPNIIENGTSAYENGSFGPATVFTITNPEPFWDPPSAPTGLSIASINATGLTLSWTNPSTGGPFTWNTVYRGVEAGSCSFTSTTWVLATTSEVVTGLTAGTIYCFSVTVSNSTGQSSESAHTSATTSPVPNAPTGFTNSSQGRTYINWTWTNPTNSVLTDSYLFYRNAATCTSGATKIDIGSVATHYNLTGLVPGDLYCVYVEAVSGTDASAGSGHTITYTYLSGGPLNLSGSPTGSYKIDLTWTNPTGNLTNTYVFYASWNSISGTCGTYTEITVGSGVSTYTVTGLRLLQTYCFYVEVANGVGVSPVSAVVWATT